MEGDASISAQHLGIICSSKRKEGYESKSPGNCNRLVWVGKQKSGAAGLLLASNQFPHRHIPKAAITTRSTVSVNCQALCPTWAEEKLPLLWAASGQAQPVPREEPAEVEQAGPVCGTERPCSPQQQQARFHGAHGHSAMEHTLLAPLAPQLNASTHCCLSDHVPLGCGLAPLCPALLLGERGDLPDLSVPSTLAKATAWCCRHVSSGTAGTCSGGLCMQSKSWLKALFSSDLCWHALAAGGIRQMTRVQEQGRRSQPFQQIERKLMRGWHAFSICERIREQGDSAWLQPPEAWAQRGLFWWFSLGSLK